MFLQNYVFLSQLYDKSLKLLLSRVKQSRAWDKVVFVCNQFQTLDELLKLLFKDAWLVIILTPAMAGALINVTASVIHTI